MTVKVGQQRRRNRDHDDGRIPPSMQEQHQDHAVRKMPSKSDCMTPLSDAVV